MEEEEVEEVISGHRLFPGWSGRDSFPSYLSKRKQIRQQAQRPEAWLSASFVALVHCPPAGRPRAQWVRVAGPGAKRPAA